MSSSYRFTFTGIRGADEKAELQLAELNLYDQNGKSILLPGTRASNPLGHVINPRQMAAMAIDRNFDTKWLDGGFRANGHVSVLELVLPSMQRVASYNLWTANDVMHRDPASWLFEMRLADGEWAIIDEQSILPPAERLAPYQDTTVGFPVSPQRVNLPGWVAARPVAAPVAEPVASAPVHLSSPPPPPPPPLPTASVETAVAPAWQQQPPLDLPARIEPSTTAPSNLYVSSFAPSNLDPASLVAPSFAPDPATEASSGVAATLLMAIMVLAFVAVAVVNAAYHWRDSLGPALESSLGEERYASLLTHLAALQERLEPVQDQLAPVQAVATDAIRAVREVAHVWLGGDEGGAGASPGVAFSRVATASIAPIDGEEAACVELGAGEDEVVAHALDSPRVDVEQSVRTGTDTRRGGDDDEYERPPFAQTKTCRTS